MAGLNFVVLTGRFAAGKDTQAAILAEKIGETSEIISTGEIYMGARSKTGEYAHFYSVIAPYIEDIDVKGMLLPDGIMTQMVREVISEKVGGGKETFIFTGFPRTIGQLEYFDEMLSNFKKEVEVNSVFIEYKISDEISLERSRIRKAEMEKKGITPRPWDSDEGVAKRIMTFHREVEPMIEKLRTEGRLIEIEGSGTVSEIEIETSSRLLSKER